MKNSSRIALLLLGAAALAAAPGPAQDQRREAPLRVGIFTADPLATIDGQGRPHGLYVDLIQEIARQQDWDLEFVAGTLQEGVERLLAGRIDLMTAVAFTAEQAQTLQFGREPVLITWGQVFVRPQSTVQSVLDLKDARIAVAAGDVNALRFRETAARFGVRCGFREVPSHQEAFRSVQALEADAAVAPNVFGSAHAARYGLVGTPVIFEPVATYFAASPEAGRELLDLLDERLGAWKEDSQSYYYQSLERWFGGPRFGAGLWSRWLAAAGAGAVLLALLLTLWNRVLDRKFKSQTRRLRESEEKLRMVFDQSYQFIGLLDPQGTVLDVNQTALRFVGAEVGQVIGKPFWETPWWSHSTQVQALLRDGIARAAAGEVFRAEATHPAADGSIHYVDFTIKNVKDAAGKVVLLVPEGRDVTENKKNAQQLARLGQAVEQTAEIVIIADTAGVIDYVNPSFARVTGYSSDESLGRSLGFLRPAGGGDRPYRQMLAAIEGGATWRGQVTCRKKDGSAFDAEVTLSPILDPLGGTFATVLVWRDVSEIQRLQEDLRQAQKLDAIGTLAAGIAHDFNNILSAIFGYTELALLSLRPGDPAADHLQEVMVGAERARELVQQILTFGRRTPLQKRPLQMAPVVKEALKLIRSSIPATIEIREDLAAAGTVLADASQIHQVVMNLCANAYQAMEESGGLLTISLRAVRRSEAEVPAGLAAGAYMVLEVADTGPGMDALTQQKIFEPYFTTKEPGKGTGLGLAVVHGIVKGHNGWICVHSEPGRGATFSVWLPQLAPARDADGARPLPRPQGARAGRLMFVDDEASLAKLARDFLGAQGYQVQAFTDPRAALQALTAEPQAWDLLITDQTMPGLTGAELAQAALDLRADLPVILCTGYSSVIDRQRAAARGIRHFAAKPLVMSELAATVQGILASGQDRPA